MENFLAVSNATSLEADVMPYVRDRLESIGYAVIRLGQSAHIASELLFVASFVGKHLGFHFSYNFLEGESERSHLAVHTEGISYASGIVPYFALGCIKCSEEGGHTRIFDARKAALLVEQKGLAGIVIEYSSLAHPNQVVEYPLVVEDPSYGSVLRFRDKVITNRMILDGTVEENQVYEIVNNALEDSILHIHDWVIGDILFVNNKITLHDRLSYTGHRSMLRIRFDDSLHRNFKF